MWSVDDNPAPLPPTTNQSTVDLVLKSTEEEFKIWSQRSASFVVLPLLGFISIIWRYHLKYLSFLYSFELRLRISLSPGKLTLIPRVRNIDSKSLSFMYALRNYLSISDIRFASNGLYSICSFVQRPVLDDLQLLGTTRGVQRVGPPFGPLFGSLLKGFVRVRLKMGQAKNGLYYNKNGAGCKRAQ